MKVETLADIFTHGKSIPKRVNIDVTLKVGKTSNDFVATDDSKEVCDVEVETTKPGIVNFLVPGNRVRIIYPKLM